jgi:hypothetical protein
MSPYSDGYATDPLFTTGAWEGMVDRRTPGTAWFADAAYTPADKRLSVTTSDAWYKDSAVLGGRAAREWDTLATYRFYNTDNGIDRGLLFRVGYIQLREGNDRLRYFRFQFEYSSRK